VSERLACRVLGQHRSTQRKVPRGRADGEALTADIIALASQYGPYGYRRITALLRNAGWAVNAKRVEGSTHASTAAEGAEGACETTQKGEALVE